MGEEKKILEEALRLDPGSRIYLTLAKLYLQEENFAQAKEVLEKGLNYFPDSLETLTLLIATYKKLGEEEKALEILNSIWSQLEKNGFFWEFLNQKEGELVKVGSKLVFLGLTKKELSFFQVLDKGIKSFLEEETNFYEEEVENLDFDQEVLTPSLGEVLLSQGEYDKALDVYKKLLEKTDNLGEKQKLKEKIDQIEKLKEKDKDIGPEEVVSEEKIEETVLDEVEETEERVEVREEEKEDKEEELIDFLEELADSLEQRSKT